MKNLAKSDSMTAIILINFGYKHIKFKQKKHYSLKQNFNKNTTYFLNKIIIKVQDFLSHKIITKI